MASARYNRDLERSHRWQSSEITDTKNSAKRVDERKTNKDYLKRILSIMSDGNLMQYSNHIKSSPEKDSRSS